MSGTTLSTRPNSGPTLTNPEVYLEWLRLAQEHLRDASDGEGNFVCLSVRDFLAKKLGVTLNQANEINRWLGEMGLRTSPKGNAIKRTPHVIDMSSPISKSKLEQARRDFEKRRNSRNPSRPLVDIDNGDYCTTVNVIEVTDGQQDTSPDVNRVHEVVDEVVGMLLARINELEAENSMLKSTLEAVRQAVC